MGKKNQNYNSGKLPKLWDLLVEMHKTNPEAFSADGNYLRAIVAQRWKALDDATHCPNCAASMQMYIETFDYHDAKLLQSMAEVVQHNVRKGMPFTEANQVKIQQECKCSITSKRRQSKCRTLGLVAMVRDEEGRHDDSKWLITNRGWAMLRCDAIPRKVKVFRNEIVERYDEMTTMQEVMNAKQDHFDPKEWYEVSGLAEGTL